MTITTINLPSGGWAHLRPATALTEAQRRPVRRALQRWSAAVVEAAANAGVDLDGDDVNLGVVGMARLNAADADAIDAANDLMAVAVVEAWSYPDPVTVDALLNLPAGDYDAIREAAAGYRDAFMGIDATVSADPASPTVPSNA